MLRELTERCGQAGTQTTNVGIQACTHGALWEPALQLLSDLVTSKGSPDELTYISALLVLALSEPDQRYQALAIFRESVECGVLKHSSRTHAGAIDLHRPPVEVAKLAVLDVLSTLLAQGRFE